MPRAPIISAEIGVNWQPGLSIGNLLRMIADCGCDAVKVQTFRAEDVLGAERYWYHWPGKSQRELPMFRELQMGEDCVRAVATVALEYGLIFHGTPESVEGVSDLKALGCQYVKLASPLLAREAIVDAILASNMTPIVSTGGGSETMVDSVLRNMPRTAYVLHCVSEYPTQDRRANLPRIASLRTRFPGYRIGYSDHTVGVAYPVRAWYEYGAEWIEVHVTLDKTANGPDHWWSKDPRELAEIVRCLK